MKSEQCTLGKNVVRVNSFQHKTYPLNICGVILNEVIYSRVGKSKIINYCTESSKYDVDRHTLLIALKLYSASQTTTA